jgi:protein arginine N-methyltransferase 1
MELSIVPVECPGIYREVDFWERRLYGLDFSPVRSFAANSCFMTEFDSSAFLSAPQPLFKIDPATVQSTFMSGHVSCIANRTGVFHGIGGWFRARLSQNVELSNDPRNKSAHWDQILFPLTSPVPVSSGDRIEMTVSTNDGKIWRWKVEVGAEQSDQCSWFGEPLTEESRIKHSPDFRPKLSGPGEATLFLLRAFNGERSSSEIQQEFLQRHSGTFASESAAMEFFSGTLSLSRE